MGWAVSAFGDTALPCNTAARPAAMMKRR